MDSERKLYRFIVLFKSLVKKCSKEVNDKLIISEAKSTDKGIHITDDENAERSLNSRISNQPKVNDGSSPVLSLIRSNRTSRSRRRPSRRLSMIKEMSGSSCSDLSAVARVSHRGIRHEMSGYSCNEGEKKITAKSKEHSPAKNIDESIISWIYNSEYTSIEKSTKNK